MGALSDWAFVKEALTHPYTLGGLVGIAGLLYYTSESRKLRNIPSMGFSDPILSYLNIFRFLFKCKEMVEEGYYKYKGKSFKVSTPTRWMVVVTGPQLMEELRKTPDDILSFDEATDETLQTHYTMGAQISENPYHIPIVRSQLTRNLANVFPELRDEIVASFADVIPPTTEWRKYKGTETFLKIIARASNRTFVGLPLCWSSRDPEFNEIGIQFTLDVIKTATILRMLPSFLRPLFSYVLNSASSRIRKAHKHMAPVIEERRMQREINGENKEHNPLDFLTWLMDEADEKESTTESLTRRILAMDFAAIHTSTMSFMQALFWLAAKPQYIKPLREEVEEVISREGWSKASLDKMRKVDSFIRESMRVNPLGCLMTTRKALKDFTFSDGTFIPKGTFVCLPSEIAQLDAHTNENGFQFEGFRFSDKNKDVGNRRFDTVAVGPDFLAFGLGRHACPGRFFAANELKVLLSHVVLNYDVKFETEGVRPNDLLIANSRVPNPTAEVMFRKRAT